MPQQPAANHKHPTRLTMGIDPGTAIVGYAVVAEQDSKLSLVVCDVLTTPAGMALPQRLQRIYRGLSELIEQYQPQDVAVEELFFAKNARTALAVGQARGVTLLAAVNAGLEISEYTPMQVKQAVHGYGNASKQQVAEMVRILLRQPSLHIIDDATDAAAIAICHLHSSAYLGRTGR
ncbi:MAG TPA: crossover junction endodeoxyribonuclease RuvC [Ktedonobacterales bacterium]